MPIEVRFAENKKKQQAQQNPTVATMPGMTTMTPFGQNFNPAMFGKVFGLMRLAN